MSPPPSIPEIQNRCVQLLQPLCIEPSYRRAMLASVFASGPKPDIDITGPPHVYTQLLVSTLWDYGTVRPGVPALAAALDYARDGVGVDKVEEIDRLQGFIRSYCLDTAGPPTPDALRESCPYIGIRPYQEVEAPLFRGREADINQLLDRLSVWKQIFITGSSGSGKSSLITAGLIPRLKQHHSAEWDIVMLSRPGSDPLGNLLQSLRAAPSTSIDQAIRDRLAQDGAPKRVLMVIDQFEQILNQPDTVEWKRQREAFFEALKSLSRIPEVSLIVALRSDFFEEVLKTPHLRHLAERQRIEIQPLKGKALGEVLSSLAHVHQVRLDDDMLDRLVQDTEYEPSAMVAVQETMTLLWQRQKENRITLAMYEAIADEYMKEHKLPADEPISGLAVAMALHADDVFTRLGTEPERVIARRILLRLVQFGEGRPNTSRQLAVEDLTTAKQDKSACTPVLEFMDANGLAIYLAANGASVVELAHETLISGWTLIRDMTQDEATRKGELFRRELEATARTWANNRENSGYLLRDSPLAHALEWRKAHPDEESPLLMRLFEHSMQAQTRRNRERILLIAGIAAVLTLVAAFAVLQGYRWWLWNEALSANPLIPIAADGETAFSINQFEVSYFQYRRCVAAEACTPPLEWSGVYQYSQSDGHLPITYISAVQAVNFCQWLGLTLPTREQWLAAAVGNPPVRTFPWGDQTPDSGRMNVPIDGPNVVAPTGPAPVDSFGTGQTPQQVRNLFGNVAEWTRSTDCAPDTDCALIWNDFSHAPDGQLLVMGRDYSGIVAPDNVGSPMHLPQAYDAQMSWPAIGFRCASN